MSSRKAQRPVYKPFHKVLQELDRLERSSPNFPDQLVSLLSREIFQGSDVCKSLRNEDAAWLIEYLDNALDTLDPVDPAYRKCLDVLQTICYNVKMLPRAYILDVSSFVPIAVPTSMGPYKTIDEGSINDSKACAKKLNPALSSQWRHVKPYVFGEIVKWKRLTHPNIVRFLGITDEPIRFVWARAPGVELKGYINNHPDTNRLDLLTGIADGLNYLHSHDVTHGDLGGPNIIVDDSGRPCITEYGLYGLFPWLPQTNVCRCLQWADPSSTRRSWREGDVFSFAMVIVEVFTGQAPFFPQPEWMALIALRRGERPKRPTHVDLTAKLWALVKRCWGHNEASRPKISEVLGILRDCRNSARVLVPVLPPASSGWFSQIANEILDLTDQVASVALFGPIGVGKTFVARTILDNDRTKAKFGESRYFICCDGLENSLQGFIQRLSGAIHVDETHLESRLRSSPPLILLLDGVDYALDPLSPEAEEIRAMIEEFGSYEHVCLVTTSRMYPDIHGFHRVEVPTPTEGGAQDIFYSLCNLARSPTVDTLITKLDFHPFSIELFARTIHKNSWDEQTLLKMWDDPKGMLRTTYYEKLKKTIEPVFHSPRIKELGTAARDVLEEIASFRSGIEEHQLEGIFCGTGGVREVVDVLCRFSLISRQNGVLKMLSPLQFYFLESMLVYAETEEVIRWGPVCMPAQGVPTVYTQGPPDGWLLHPSPLRPTILQNIEDTPRQPCPPVLTKAPSRREWIRSMPQISKKRLRALFGRQAVPTIVINRDEDLASILPIALQENIPPTTAQEAPAKTSPAAAQEDFVRLSLRTAPQQRIPPEVTAYEIGW